MQTALDRAMALVEQEKMKSPEELLELWKGRRDSAWHWYCACMDRVTELGGDNDPRY